MTTTDTTPAAPLTPERETEIRQTHPGDWYAGPWYSEYIDGQADEPAYYRVVHQESGTTLATLPDWAGPIAAFFADAPATGHELLAELDRLRARVAELEQINSNAQKLVDGWLKTSGEHFAVSHLDQLKATPHLAGIQAGRADQYSDCANELRDVLNGEDPDHWEHGISISATQAAGGTR